jgi:uncharacterized protein
MRMDADPLSEVLSLLDWRRRISDLYAVIRATEDKRAAWRRWQETRAFLFRGHPQSPVPAAQRQGYSGPYLYDYDLAWSLTASVEPVERRRMEITTSDSETMAFERFGVAHFEQSGVALSLDLYWLEGYGGGLFVPFADATSGHATYGAGRYLLDTVKGADLGQKDDLLVLDFNFAYQPSCAYDPRWSCPLAPPSNRLSVPVGVGERVGSQVS